MKSFSRKVGIVVDAFSTGKHIAPALKMSGYDCVHILSDANHPKKHLIDVSHYVETLTYTSVENIVAQFNARGVLFCIAGDESGVILADQISHTLELSTSNGIEHTLAKRNKYLMNEVAERAGLSVVRHFKSTDLQSLLDWIKTIGTWPIVLKPLDSASGDGVYICKNYGEITEKFYGILSSQNKFGKQNQEVLAEEFNAGTEYIINTVSCRGRHHIVEIWRMNKLPDTIIHDTCELLDRRMDADLFFTIETYCFKLLDTFAMRFGACTIELKCVEGCEPVLIEIGARLMGDAELSLTYNILGYNQLSLMLDAYLAPSTFNRIADHPSAATTYALAVLLISPSQGTLQRELSMVEYLMSLSPLHSYQVPMIGDKITVTKNVATCPGIIYLKHPDKVVLENIRNEIRALEQSGLYSDAIQVLDQIAGEGVYQEMIDTHQSTPQATSNSGFNLPFFNEQEIQHERDKRIDPDQAPQKKHETALSTADV